MYKHYFATFDIRGKTIGGPLSGKTEAECAELCDKELDCIALQYIKNSKTCQLHSTSPGLPVKSSVSNPVSYHRRL